MRNVDKNLWTKIFISVIYCGKKKKVNLNFQWEND